jgi:dihydroorotate dehydrogenase
MMEMLSHDFPIGGSATHQLRRRVYRPIIAALCETTHMFELFRCALFKLEPERAHAIALSALQAAHRAHLLPRSVDRDTGVECMGLKFPNRIGLAAGFDKNARYVDALGGLGFGCIEVGTVTPRPQRGQSRPRVFRLPQQRALINRMGFPNEGAHAVAERLQRRAFGGVVGVNIGKNAATPLGQALDDYVTCFRVLAPHADYVVVNVSSPNTQDLRLLQQADQLRPILEAMLEERRSLPNDRSRSVRLLTKVSPDLSEDELISIAELLVELGIEGVIATNTTVSRPSSLCDAGEASMRQQAGGLSGEPLHVMSLSAIRTLKRASEGRVTIIGVGGIESTEHAAATLNAGADLLQIYTGMIYRGPRLVRELIRAFQ